MASLLVCFKEACLLIKNMNLQSEGIEDMSSLFCYNIKACCGRFMVLVLYTNKLQEKFRCLLAYLEQTA